MGHTYTNLLTHVIFSTKDRAPLVEDEIRNDLHAYMGGIVRHLGGEPIMINGPKDHVHMLLVLPADKSASDCLRTIKTNSSKWIHEKWPARESFAWQTGYSAFAVSDSNREKVIAYIRDQQEHHRKFSFEEEFIAFLKKNKIPYDSRFVLG